MNVANGAMGGEVEVGYEWVSDRGWRWKVDGRRSYRRWRMEDSWGEIRGH